ncbi:MAG: hypothetical protein JKY80_01980 [Mariprofundaceae bacterium]|nr:hypothetical protein [Methylophaga sp.]MBL4759609.1 hypothetical protein [Mariprofundaceae bacterium]
MRYFVENKTGETFACEKHKQSGLIKALDLNLYTEMTASPMPNSSWDAIKKAWVLDAAKVSAELIATHNAPIFEKMIKLESAQSNRLLREAYLGNAASKATLSKIDADIAKLRVTLK